MHATLRVMAWGGLFALVGCSSGSTSAVGSNNTQDDCVPLPGAADCSNGSTGTGTGNGTGNATGTGSTSGVDTWVGSEDAGSGPGASLYEVDARIDAVRKEDSPGVYRMQADIRVEVWDAGGNPMSGQDLSLDSGTLGEIALVEDTQNNPGRYEAKVDGYTRTYTLNINPDLPNDWFSTTAIGPELQIFALPPVPWDVTQPVTVQWSPGGAMFAEIDTRGGGKVDIPDVGAYEIPAFTLDSEVGKTDEERVKLTRWDILDVTAALPTSTFEISVETKADNLDTEDSRTGTISGNVDLDNAFAGQTGDVYILAWPNAVDPEFEPAWLWTKIADVDFTDTGSYQITGMEPGDWYMLAYLDADGSDLGLLQLAGPTTDDPFDDKDVTIDPNGNGNRDFNLRDPWQGW